MKLVPNGFYRCPESNDNQFDVTGPVTLKWAGCQIWIFYKLGYHSIFFYSEIKKMVSKSLFFRAIGPIVRNWFKKKTLGLYKWLGSNIINSVVLELWPLVPKQLTWGQIWKLIIDIVHVIVLSSSPSQTAQEQSWENRLGKGGTSPCRPARINLRPNGGRGSWESPSFFPDYH